MPAKKDAAYYRDYRARKAQASDPDVALAAAAEATGAIIGGEFIPADPGGDIELAWKADGSSEVRVKSDREMGLPRTNYFSDPSMKGGWGDTIRNMNPRLAQRILEHPAIKTARR
jgi:hypothetical protein